MKRFSLGFLLVCLLVFRATPGLALPPDDIAAAGSSWVEWDRSSERVVSAPTDTGAAYPRAKQLSNGEILLGYHHGSGLGDYGSYVTLRKSRDGGATWYQTQQVDGPNEKGYYGFCNPDFIELGGGRVMLVSAARGKADPFSRDEFVSECRHGGLRVRFSNNYGTSWGPPRMIAAGRGRLWEPSVVRLPSGELEIFYANESANLQVEGSRQCIEAIRSQDEGQTWSSPTIVSEDPGCRNGMPAALTLTNGHVACVEEVVGSRTSPWIADTLHGHTTGSYHLAQDQYDFGAAPFLARVADGSTLLAFHSQHLQTPGFKQLPMSWLFSQIYVQHGDAGASDFGTASCPWPMIEPRTGRFFPSLMVMNGGTLVVLASFITVNPNNTTSTVVRWIKGRMLAPAPGVSPSSTLGNVSRPSKEETSAISSEAEPPPATSRPSKREYKYGPPTDEEPARAGAGY